MEDNDFLLSLQRGDPDAFARLVNQHQHRVTNICYRFLCSKEDAQDVTQEVFFEVYKSIGKFRQEAKLSTWIYRIAVTRSLNFLQKYVENSILTDGGMGCNNGGFDVKIYVSMRPSPPVAIPTSSTPASSRMRAAASTASPTISLLCRDTHNCDV